MSSLSPLPSPIKVLHVVNGDHYAGAERVQDLLALKLSDHGYEIGFATLKNGLFAEKRKAKHAALHEAAMRGKADLSIPLRIAGLVRQHDYKLIHTHTARSVMVGRIASLLAGVPMVHHVHSPTARNTEDELRNKINVLVERLSLLGVRRLIPVSDSMAQYMREHGYSDSKLRTVPNGVPSRRALDPRQTPGPDWTVGMVALFRPRKGLEMLLQAISTLRAHGHQARLLAVGPFETDSYRDETLALCRKLGVQDAIEWTGFTADVNAQFDRMDVFALPSLYGEGMPMVVLEAMASGVPVVASAVEGIPEVVQDGGTGLLVSPGDPDALASALAEFMSGQRDWQAMRAAAWLRQGERFSDRSMAAGVAEVYDGVLGRTAPARGHGA